MSNELILAVLLTIVLLADLIIRSLKKKVKTDDSLKIGEEAIKKRRFNFNYFKTRKRNLIIFILLSIILKPAVHYQFFTEFENYINTEKKLPSPEKRKDFLKLSNINHNIVKIYQNLFVENIIDPNQIFYGDLRLPETIDVPIREFSKNYYLKSDEFDLNRLRYKYNMVIEGDMAYSKKNHWIVGDYNSRFVYDSYMNGIASDASNYFKNINVPNFKDNYFFLYNNNYVIDLCVPMLNEEKTGIDYYGNGWVVRLIDYSGIGIHQLYMKNKRNGTIFKNFEFIEKKDFEPITKLDTIEGYKKMMESGMYMDYKTKLLYDTQGNQVVTEKGGKMVNFFIHPNELRKADFMFHFDNIFKIKLWLFALSFSFMGLLVLLFNDKIQAR